MKLSLVTSLMAVGIATTVCGQGVIFDNAGNSGAQNATSNGLLYNQDGTVFDGANYNVGVNVYTSVDGATYTLFGTYTPGNDPKGYTGLDAGQFQLGTAFATVNIPGVTPGNSAFFELQFWSGAANGSGVLASTWDAAVAAGDPTATVFFSQVTSNPGGAPPTPAGNFSSMPSVTLIATPVPEPATLALAGLGGLGILMAVRRKKA